MTTKLINVREFRQNLAKYGKQAKKGDTRFIVLRNNEPLFEVKPFDKKDYALALLEAEIAEARKDIKAGRYISQEEMMKKYGIL